MSEVERVALPDELPGPWEHAVIMTYGADLAFYEQDLWRKFGRARNRIVLVDDRHLAAAYTDAAADGRLRHVNANYLASPVRNAAACHAKIILLAGPDAGRLLIGSGNLGMSGYASQGELFCRYDYNPQDPSQLPAFHSVRELLETITSRGYLDDIAAEHLRHLWGTATWLFTPTEPAWRPVRHNLDESLLDQLIEAVGDEAVTELTVHAPFWDPGCQALRRLIERLAPARVRVLLQAGETAVDGAQLEQVLEASGIAWEARTVEAEEPTTYLHAKFIVVRQTTRAVCLQGSANLSLAALPFADPRANIEAGNLLVGDVDAFTSLVSALTLSQPQAPTSLDLRKPSGEEDGEDDEAGLTIISAEWHAPRLRLHLSRPLAAEAATAVLAGGQLLEAAEMVADKTVVTAAFQGEATERLERMVAVAIQVIEAGQQTTTPAVYPYRRAALRSLLQQGGDDEVLSKAGSLNLEDDELIRLLKALDDTLPIDARSIWRLAGKSKHADVEDDADGPHQRYEDIDWDLLRRHPKIAQYRAAAGGYETGGLQLLLSSITDHFRGLGSQASAAGVPRLDELEETEGDDFGDEDLQGLLGEEIDVEDPEQPDELDTGGQPCPPTHHQTAFKRFIRRYLSGVEDEKFLELVGVHVMADNFAIFNALLSRLPSMGWLKDEQFCLDAQLRLWELWWGTAEAPGILDRVEDEELLISAELLGERAADVGLVRALARSEALCSDHRWHARHIRLRDVWRRMLTSPVLAFTQDVLAQAAPSAAPVAPPLRGTASRIAAQLSDLAWTLTPHDVRQAVARALDLPVDKVALERGRVMRGGAKEGDEDVVVVDVEANPLTSESAPQALAAWLAVDRAREYYRVNHRTSKAVAVHDRAFGETWWYAEDLEDFIDLDPPQLRHLLWEHALDQLVASASAADQTAREVV